jgi:mRNA-degrading endonuclease RelE of RelBE toxin-antitoxin system
MAWYTALVAYAIRFTATAERHFDRLSAREQRTVLDKVRVQLRFQPDTETKNRKQLRPNPLAGWELRIGFLRVFYEIGSEAPEVVSVVAIGIKKGNRLFIGGEEMQL